MIAWSDYIDIKLIKNLPILFNAEWLLDLISVLFKEPISWLDHFNEVRERERESFI